MLSLWLATVWIQVNAENILSHTQEICDLLVDNSDMRIVLFSPYTKVVTAPRSAQIYSLALKSKTPTIIWMETLGLKDTGHHWVL